MLVHRRGHGSATCIYCSPLRTWEHLCWYIHRSPSWMWEHCRLHGHDDPKLGGMKIEIYVPTLQGHSAIRSLSLTLSTWSAQWAAPNIYAYFLRGGARKWLSTFLQTIWFPAPAKATDFSFFLMMPHLLAASTDRP